VAVAVRIGTAGWSIPREHAASFTPLGNGDDSALARYARVFDAVEINSSFWRHHKPETYARWARTVPSRFRFALKVPRAITHEHGLRGAACARVLDQFLDEVAALGRKLGPLLVQLPPSFALEPRVARAFFRMLRARHEGDVACEPRHASWLTPRADALLASMQIARVAADPPRPPGADVPGGDPSWVYVRLHGSPRMYYSPYGADRIATMAAALRGRARHARVWCFFDNTASGAAAGDALARAALQPARGGARTRAPTSA
jgi:uncharacterized protein YecE (DUF72 family)